MTTRTIIEVARRGRDGDYTGAADVAAVNLKATRADTRVFDVRAYGAVGDGIADDTAAIQACITACKAGGSGTALRRAEFYIPAGMSCLVSAQLNLRHILNVNIRGQIKSSYTAGPCVIVGHSSNSAAPTHVYIHQLERVSGGATNITLRTIGIKNGNVTVNFTPYMQVYADTSTDATNDGSTAYSRFTLGFVDRLDVTGVGAMSWINENTFDAMRINRLNMSGPYLHNNNKFYANFEGTIIDIQSGEANYITGRFEGTNTITFGTNANFNHVVQSWNVQRTNVDPNVTVTDNGLYNYVYTTAEAAGEYQVVLRIDAGAAMTSTANPFPPGHVDRRVRPGFDLLYLPNTFTNYLDTGVFSVVGYRYDLRRMVMASDVSNWRAQLYTYGANMSPIQGLAQLGAWSWNGTESRYEINANVSWAGIPMLPTVRFARLVITGGSPVNPFRYFTISAHQPPGTSLDAAPIVRAIKRPLYQVGTTTPAQSLLPIGERITTDTGVLLVTHRQDYTTAVHASGNTFVNVGVTVTGVNTGDNVAVELANGQTHFTTVASTSTTFINLTAALPSSTAAGGRVATQRFKHIST